MTYVYKINSKRKKKKIKKRNNVPGQALIVFMSSAGAGGNRCCGLDIRLSTLLVCNSSFSLTSSVIICASFTYDLKTFTGINIVMTVILIKNTCAIAEIRN